MKGIMTQGLVVLAERPFDHADIESALEAFEVVKRCKAEATRNWMSGNPSWTLAMRREVNGLVVVEVLDAPWPDHMGDPKQEPELFAAWSMGLMGIGTWPGSLSRAMQYASIFRRNQTVAAAQTHKAFVRIASSYVLGRAQDNSKVIPQDYEPRTELDFVISVAQAIARLPGALCHFNPTGETLYSASEFDSMLGRFTELKVPPYPLFAGARMVKFDDAPPWMLADVVGMMQLDAQDHEACFQMGRHDPNEILAFLHNMSAYTHVEGPVIESGHTTDGPGGRWRAIEMDESLLPRPRKVLRWLPDDVSRLPPQLLPKTAQTREPNRGLLGRLGSLFKK